jgi:hypothetical protein
MRCGARSGMRPGLERQHLERNVREGTGELDKVIDLSGHHLAAPHLLAQGGLAHDHSQLPGAAGNCVLPRAVRRHSLFSLLVGVVSGLCRRDDTGIAGGLQQRRYQLRVVQHDLGRRCFHDGEVREPLGDHVRVLIPPAPVARAASQAHEGGLLRFRHAVLGEQLTELLGPDCRKPIYLSSLNWDVRCS